MFYSPDIATTLMLSEEESQHCVQVLRAQRGKHILVSDGQGTLYHCAITNPHRKHCEVEIVSTEQPAPLHEGYVHIAIAPTKNMDRLEWMVEKCTEMGVDEITPILCEHSERKVVNDERLQKIMIAAAKQSLKATFPKLNSLTRISDLLTSATEDDRLIAHCMTEEGATDSEQSEAIQANYAPSASKNALHKAITRGHSVVILIGPEGDFSEREVATAIAAGFRPISLGAARLRTETAGLVACHTAILLNE